MAFAAMTLDTPKVARASATTGIILRLTTSMPRAVRGNQRCWMYSETVGTEFSAEATEKEGERVHEGGQTDRLSKWLSQLFRRITDPHGTFNFNGNMLWKGREEETGLWLGLGG